MTTIYKNRIKDSKILNIFILFILGALTSFSLDPYNFIIINFFTFPTFFLIIKNNYTKKIFVFFLGWSFGFGYFASSLYWISYSLTFEESFKKLIPFAIICVPLIISIFYGVSTLTCSFFKLKKNFSSLIIFALFLSFFEYLRSVLFTGFPWNLISYSLVSFSESIQILSIIGTYSFNLLIITSFLFPIILFFQISRRKKIILFVIFFALLTLNFFFGSYTIKNLNSSPKVNLDNKIKIIAPGIKLERYFKNENLEDKITDLIKLMKSKSDEKVIYILPEGILTGIYLEDLKLYNRYVNKNLSKNHYIILGINSKKNGNVYNSLVLLDSELNLLYKYDKNKLVPFGEYLPFENYLKKFGLKKLTEGYQPFSSSKERKIIHFENLSILPLICYEVIYSGQLTNLKKNYDVIVNISEDGWFGDTIGPYQHLSKSIFRSIEEGKNIFRSSNNGITALINPNGVILERIESTESGVISVDNIQFSKKTLFSQHGNKIFFYFVIFYITLIFFLKRKDL